MKVFWAWQSDHPGRISRYAVREALKRAIEHLKEEVEIDEPPEEARRRDIHLDHDTEGLTGMPSIAAAIFKKISESTVVVCDMTPVGATPTIEGNEGDKPGRPLMNPNVAIELGYALGTIGDANVLGVLNVAFGSAASLPFDIIHKKWPVMYTLVEEATAAEIEEQVKLMRAEFIKRLRGFIKTEDPEKPFAEMPVQAGRGLFFKDGDVLAVQRNNPLSHGRELRFTMPDRSYAYLRVIPKKSLSIPLSEELLKNTIGRFGTFGIPVGALIQENEYGVAMSNLNPEKLHVESMTQYFRNGEIGALVPIC
jgi:hypothetical protein